MVTCDSIGLWFILLIQWALCTVSVHNNSLVTIAQLMSGVVITIDLSFYNGVIITRSNFTP